MLYFENDRLDSLLDMSDAVIFDLNGLIVDDEPIQLMATGQALSSLGIRMNREVWAARCVGRRDGDFLGELLAEQGKDDKSIVEDVLRHKREAYQRLLLRPGVTTFHAWLLKSCRRQVALATSSSREDVEAFLNSVAAEYKFEFNCMVCGEDVRQPKPSPETYHQVVTRIGPDKRYLAFEDTAVGVAAAKDAHLTCVAIPSDMTAHQDFRRADLVISDLTPKARTLRQ